jgi:hypothetical protein
MKNFLYLFIALLSFQPSIGQSSLSTVDMIHSNWNSPETASFERFDNIETLVLNSGRATVKNLNFTNGTIEVDVYANSVRSFAGITFRRQNDNMDEVYMRMHKSSQADAIQYTPILNNESNWQLFREYQAQVSFKNTGWNVLRVEVNNKSAEVFVNDEKVLFIDHLRTDHSSGEIGLFTLFTNRFSNFRVTHKDEVERPEKGDNNRIDPNIISQWGITNARPYKGEEVYFDHFLKEEYTTVKTEASGLLPISKYIKKSSSGNFEQNIEEYTIAFKTIYASKNETKLFSFDYSDKIIVYLNGKAIFRGNNAFTAKGPQYMGHMDINSNKLYLPLKKGANQIHCVVIDKANGWGIIAKLE